MFVVLLISNIVLLARSSASGQVSPTFSNGSVDNRNNHGLSNLRETFSNPLTYNKTYIDKDDNLLRVPSKYYEEPKTKKKIKKSPKRTVQKIIKKNKLKSRKLYLYPATASQTSASKFDNEENNQYTRSDVSTTEANFKKKQRKNTRYVRYPMPFQKLQRKDGTHSRFRREDRDLYILKDLDEVQFLSEEKDHDKVIAHVQKYW